jgi:YhgE/Pip-like protein
MNLLKSKLVLLSPMIVLAVVLIFGLTLTPTISPTPKNVPIAFVNEDHGVDVPSQGKINMGKTIEEKIQEMSKPTADNEPIVKRISVSSYEKAKEGLNIKSYYAAFVILKDFSLKQASLRTPDPLSPEVQIVVNQGMNTMASTMASQMLTNIVDNINQNVRTQILAEFEKQGRTLATIQASTLVAPISKKVTNVNQVGTHSSICVQSLGILNPSFAA